MGPWLTNRPSFGPSINTAKAMSRPALGPSCGPFRSLTRTFTSKYEPYQVLDLTHNFYPKQTPATRPNRLGPIKTHIESLKGYLSNALDVLPPNSTKLHILQLNITITQLKASSALNIQYINMHKHMRHIGD